MALLEKIFEKEDGGNIKIDKSTQKPKLRKKKKKLSIKEQIRETEKEVEKYRSRMQCKVCLDAYVGTLFLPCRHLLCCKECAENVQKCPLCRERIIGTIKVFVSES